MFVFGNAAALPSATVPLSVAVEDCAKACEAEPVPAMTRHKMRRRENIVCVLSYRPRVAGVSLAGPPLFCKREDRDERPATDERQPD
jgi:hypothetical protein